MTETLSIISNLNPQRITIPDVMKLLTVGRFRATLYCEVGVRENIFERVEENGETFYKLKS